MGFTRVDVELGRMSKANGALKFQAVDRQQLLVDTGATYSSLPSAVLTKCQSDPEREVSLQLADGRRVKRPLGYVWMVVEGVRIHTPVLFGESGDPALLGVIALEDANLTVDPVTCQLLKGTSYIQY